MKVITNSKKKFGTGRSFRHNWILTYRAGGKTHSLPENYENTVLTLLLTVHPFSHTTSSIIHRVLLFPSFPGECGFNVHNYFHNITGSDHNGLLKRHRSTKRNSAPSVPPNYETHTDWRNLPELQSRPEGAFSLIVLDVDASSYESSLCSSLLCNYYTIVRKQRTGNVKQDKVF